MTAVTNFWAYLTIEDYMDINRPGFAFAERLAADHIDALGVIQISDKRMQRPGDLIASQGAVKLFCPKSVQTSVGAQMVSNSAARRLLNATDALDRPLEDTLALFWETGVFPHVILGSGIRSARRRFLRRLPVAMCILRERLALAGPIAAYRPRVRTLSQLHRQWALP